MKQPLRHIHTRLILFCLFLTGGSVLFAQPVANFTASPVAGCSPLIVNFQDLSSGNPTAWSWNFGNGNTSTLQNPVASYLTPGTYTVTLTATNAGGSNTLVRTAFITVYEPPVVNFSASITSGCFPLRVQMTDLSAAGSGNTNVSWDWDFGNGQTSNLQNPLIIYTSAGVYNVTLRVTNDKGCVRTFSRPAYINVTSGVRAGFTFTQPTVCSAPAAISFTNTSTGPPVLSWFWDFGDGNTSTAQNPSHTYLSNGSFVVTLVTFSTAGCQDTLRSSPIVIGNQVTGFTGPLELCMNETGTFTNNSTPVPVLSTWNFGDGTPPVPGINATHSYSVPGTYPIKVYSQYGNCRDSFSRDIIVNPRPVSAFTAPITSSCQPPLTVNFQDLSTGTVTAWQWDFGDGNSSTAQNPSHTYTNYGNYTVTLITTNASGCTDTLIRTDFVRIRRAAITVPFFPVRGCVPYTVQPVPDVNALDAVTSWQWDFGDGGSSTLQNPTYTYTAQGTYTVRLIITTSTGCRDTLTIGNAVQVGTHPAAAFSAVPNPVCAREPVQFTDLSVPADEWFWDFGDGSTSIIQHPSHSFNDTGYFDITLIAYNNGCPDTVVLTDYIYVLPPIAVFTTASDCNNRLRFTFTDQSIAPQTWEWDFGDGSPFDNTQNPVHSYPALGVYTVRLVVTNGGCSDTTFMPVYALDERADFVADEDTACKAATIQFNTLNINPAYITSYQWNFGDGNSTSTTTGTASHTYTVAGNYTVSLTITDLNGCTSTLVRTAYIRINGPVADFSTGNISGCTGLTATFTDLSSTDGQHPVTNWFWNFGDGFTQSFTAPPFQHVYNTPGAFNVKLVITDAAGCMDSLIRIGSVTATDPNPLFRADTLTCPGASVAFTNSSTPAGLTSTWDFGDGNTAAVTSPVHSYTTPGLYTVKLVVQDAFGCRDSLVRTDYIRVSLPVASFTVSDSVTSCTPLEAQFTNTSTFATSVQWNFGTGQGVSTLNNPVHYFSAPGVYPVKLVVTSPGGCQDSVIRNITVYDTAGARINYSPLGGCKPIVISMNAFTPGPIVSYFWDFGDGNTQTTTTAAATHTYNSFGSFVPTVIMEDPSGCIIPLQGADTLLVIGARANFGVDTAFFCDFGTVQFIDSTTFNDPVIQYNWVFGDGGTSTLQQPGHTYTAQGIYNVQLSVITQNGCRDTLLKPAVVKVIDRPLIDITGDSIICINNYLLHEGVFLRTDTSLVQWQWTLADGSTFNGQQPPQQFYNTAGSFTLTAIATNSSGCKDTTRQTILVHPLPTVNMPAELTITAGFPVTIPATYTPNTQSWIWSPATGLNCHTCPAPTAGPDFNTLYQVYFTDDNNCSNTGRIQINVVCGKGNLFIPNTFSPNGDGSNDIFYPRGNGLARVKLLRIFNRWGEVVYERKDFPANNSSAGWDGRFKGQAPKADVYIYQAEVFCSNGELLKLNGNIALIL